MESSTADRREVTESSQREFLTITDTSEEYYSYNCPATITHGFLRHSRVFYCGYCCRIWGVLTIENSKKYHCVSSVSCLRCNIKGDIISPVPGSILEYHYCSDLVDYELLEHLPAKLLIREFNLTLKAYSSNDHSI